jgi:phosphohistidine phosphatase
MKSLYLMRHAKSDWQDPRLDDFDRPLSARGARAAPRMGRYLRENLETPDHILCSTAKRAALTWQLTIEAFEVDIPVTWSDDLYLATPVELTKAVNTLAPPAANVVLLIGHNPGLERLAVILAGSGSRPDALGHLKAKFPTAAVAVFECDVLAWTDLRPGRGRLTGFIRPKDLD